MHAWGRRHDVGGQASGGTWATHNISWDDNPWSELVGNAGRWALS